LAIANWYNIFPAPNDLLQLFRIGFGIRVFLNVWEKIRPYFTHDITSHLIWQQTREKYAATLGILLGLGVDFPLPGTAGSLQSQTSSVTTDTTKDIREYSSLFIDVSYNMFNTAYFELYHEGVKFFSVSAGISWLIK
jgi:hypothetical protein